MRLIGAKDKFDRALVRQYASKQTCNFDNDIKVDPDRMLESMNLLSLGQRNYVNFANNLKKVM